MTRDESAAVLALISTLWGRRPASDALIDAWADELVDIDVATARRRVRDMARDGARGPSLADLLHAATPRTRRSTEIDIEREPGCICRFEPGTGQVLCPMHVERGRRWLAAIAADRQEILT